MKERDLGKILALEFEPDEKTVERTLYYLKNRERRRPMPALWRLAGIAVMTAAAFGAGFLFSRWSEKPSPQGNYKMVRFKYYSAKASRVSVSGDFTDWERVNMKKTDGGNWEVIVRIKKNGRYKYIFVINGKEVVPDPKAKMRVDDGFGQKNSVLTL